MSGLISDIYVFSIGNDGILHGIGFPNVSNNNGAHI